MKRFMKSMVTLMASALLFFPKLEAQQCIISNHQQKISDVDGNFNQAFGLKERFGTTVEPIGDLNGDGNIDLAVGARGDNQSGSESGAVFILFLNSNGTVQSSKKITENVNGFAGDLDVVDVFGDGLAYLGDVNGDGKIELAVGAPFDDDAGHDRGAIYILSLNNDGTVSSYVKIRKGAGGLSSIAPTGDWWSAKLANVGDVNGDGINDLGVGSFGDDSSVGNNTGAVWILFLDTARTVIGYSKISATSGGLSSGLLSADDYFGNCISGIGDADNDGIPDIAVGATWDDDGGNNTGAVYILYLNASGTVKSHTKISNTSGSLGFTLPADATFGRAIDNLGDVKGDGINDLVVGSVGNFLNGTTTDEGQFYILEMNANGTVSSAVEFKEGVSGFSSATQPQDALGISACAIGDLDGNGFVDLAVGAFSDASGGFNHGAVYITFLEDSCCNAGVVFNGVDTTINPMQVLTYAATANFNNNIQWYLDDSLIGNGDSIYLQLKGNGSYVLKVKATDERSNCFKEEQITITVLVPVSVSNVISKRLQAKVYPNPVDRELKIELPNHLTNADCFVKVTNIHGKEIHHQKLAGSISTFSWSAGLYYVSIQSTSYQTNYQIVKN